MGFSLGRILSCLLGYFSQLYPSWLHSFLSTVFPSAHPSLSLFESSCCAGDSYCHFTAPLLHITTVLMEVPPSEPIQLEDITDEDDGNTLIRWTCLDSLSLGETAHCFSSPVFSTHWMQWIFSGILLAET